VDESARDPATGRLRKGDASRSRPTPMWDRGPFGQTATVEAFQLGRWKRDFLWPESDSVLTTALDRESGTSCGGDPHARPAFATYDRPAAVVRPLLEGSVETPLDPWGRCQPHPRAIFSRTDPKGPQPCGRRKRVSTSQFRYTLIGGVEQSRRPPCLQGFLVRAGDGKFCGDDLATREYVSRGAEWLRPSQAPTSGKSPVPFHSARQLLPASPGEL
jgi:hypothetical protein